MSLFFIGSLLLLLGIVLLFSGISILIFIGFLLLIAGLACVCIDYCKKINIPCKNIDKSKSTSYIHCDKIKFFTTTDIVGMSYVNSDTGVSRQDVIRRCHVGEELTLKHEPTAEHPEALAVYSELGERIGYLRKNFALSVIAHNKNLIYNAVLSDIHISDTNQMLYAAMRLTFYEPSETEETHG